MRFQKNATTPVRFRRWAISAIVTAACIQSSLAQGPVSSEFTYQGMLSDADSPVTGPCDFRFRLYDAALSGNQIGPMLALDDTSLVDGLFAVSLD